MGKDSKKKRESEFAKFAKKRAPIYLAVAALIVVFVVPELTKKDLQSYFPEELTIMEKQVLDTLMSYDGGDGTGLNVMEAVSDKINEEYPGENIYDNKKTSIDIRVIEWDDNTHLVLLDFKSYRGEAHYSWDVNINTGDVTGNNSKAKHVIDLVEFYD